MPGAWTDIADAVKVAIQGVVLTAGGTLERAYVPEKKLDSLGLETGPYVYVVVKSELHQRITRTIWRQQPEINIGVERLVASQAETDAMVAFVYSLLAVVKNAEITVPPVNLIDVKLDPLYSPDLLREKGLFQSMIRATYMMGVVAG